LPKDTKAKLRERAERIINSELFSVMPKVLSVFGIWFTLTPMMKIWEKGLVDTAKSVVPLALIAGLALGFDYWVQPWLKNFIEIPTPTPEVNLEKDLCWDKNDLQNFKRILKSFMGSRSNHLREKAAKNDLHGTNRDGSLILAGPPGNGKSAIAYGIGSLAAKPIHSLKVSETSSSTAIEAGFKEASKKGAILFIDEADAIIRSRGERVTQAFLETFNRYQRENPVRVILATNSFAEMDSAIQSRAYVFNLSNPSPVLKLDIFKKKIQDQGLKSHAYKKLLDDESGALQELLSKNDLAGRDIESIIKDAVIISEMRIDQQLLASKKQGEDSSRVLDPNDNRIKLEDIELAIKEFMQNHEKAIKASI
jgi:SpoVK/Ycf46/Vps4 family AAA+-type ATPase